MSCNGKCYVCIQLIKWYFLCINLNFDFKQKITMKSI